MEIRASNNVPDSTYFRTGDVSPFITGDAIVMLNGQGTRRKSWGAPGVTSTVIVDESEFVAIHVGFYHKHGGGQFWRYFQQGEREIHKVEWKSLSEEKRLLVLDAWIAKAPGWAKQPGKLRSQYLKPSELTQSELLEDGRIVGYKRLLYDDDGNCFRSPVAYGNPCWPDGFLEADREPAKANTHGIYAVKNHKDPELNRFQGKLVKLALSGIVVEHNRGYRAQIAEILEVL